MVRRTGTSVMLASCCTWLWVGASPVAAQIGACCRSFAVCSMIDEAACSATGIFLGAGTDCGTVDCSGMDGACCIGFCVPDNSPQDCNGQSGIFLGLGSTCSFFTNCSATAGACCLTGGSCNGPLAEGDCGNLGGTYAGDGTFCSLTPDPCDPPQRGACCFPSTCIDDTLADGCANATGIYRGDGTTCGVCGNNIVEGCEVCDGTDDSACPGECDPLECACPVPAFAIKWHSVDGGGGISSGGTIKLLGAIGQSDAGKLTGGTFVLSGGFLAGAATAPLPTAPIEIPTYPHGARKQRYISFAPDAGHTLHAYQVRDVGSGTTRYISTPRTTPASVAGQGLTFVVSDASPVTFKWTSTPRVHVGGCLIAPGTDSSGGGTGREYRVRATPDGVTFSSELTLFTAARPTAANARLWADIVGLFAAGGDGTTTPPTPVNSWTPANRSVSGFDISAALQGAASSPTAPHFTWGDISPELTDRVANGPDTLRVVNAFGTGTGKEFYPFAYPVAPSAIHHPTTPPAPALCPVPPASGALNP